jgi:RNA polymerase sigma-70 factor (ECF subfamily)
MASVDTVMLNGWVDRMRAGDMKARDELLRAVCDRLERLARKMLRRFPSVQRWAQTDDVLQNALLRLLRALQEVRPNSVRDFFGLAAEQIRRELLDLARQFNGRDGVGANHASDGDRQDWPPAVEPRAATDDVHDLERWTAFHQGVADLPDQEREVVALVFYHGWSQTQVAELLGLSVRTVQRRWRSALRALHCYLHDLN